MTIQKCASFIVMSSSVKFVYLLQNESKLWQIVFMKFGTLGNHNLWWEIKAIVWYILHCYYYLFIFLGINHFMLYCNVYKVTYKLMKAVNKSLCNYHK